MHSNWLIPDACKGLGKTAPFKDMKNLLNPSSLSSNFEVQSGTLYIVATPIGNWDDITLRALKVLETVDVIAAEDTRKTGKLLAHYGIRGRLVSCHEHNEKARTTELLQKLEAGLSVALVSDAGTPAVSDPGYHLVHSAVEQGVTVVPIPGVSAVIAALSVAGLPTDAFVFVGFLSKKQTRRIQQLHALAQETRTIIVYESPRRIVSLLREMESVLGDRYAVLSREITKIHEEFIRGAFSQIRMELDRRPTVKGECTLLISGSRGPETVSMDTIRADIEKAFKANTGSLSSVVRDIVERYGVSKSKIYAEALKLKDRMNS